jgi:pimeloyl-ACP methyl ester carboxylesterase
MVVASPLAKNYRVICVDRPGCGYSVRSGQADPSLEAQADTMALLLDHLGVDSAIFAGHSLGGAISSGHGAKASAKSQGTGADCPLTHLPDEPAPVFKALDIASPFARRLIGWTLAVPGTIYPNGMPA